MTCSTPSTPHRASGPTSSTPCTGTGRRGGRSSSRSASTRPSSGRRARSGPTGSATTPRCSTPGSTWCTTGCTSWCGPTPTTPGAATSRSGGGVARRPRRARIRSNRPILPARAPPQWATCACPTARRRGSTAGRGATTPSTWRAAAPWWCTPRRSTPATSAPRRRVSRRAPSWRPTSWRPWPTGPARPASSRRPGRARPGCSPSGCATSWSTGATSPVRVLAVAYNRKARDEMVERTVGLGGRMLDPQRLGYGIAGRRAGAPARRRRGARGPPPPRTARPHRCPPPQHRSAGALPRGAHDHPAGAARRRPRSRTSGATCPASARCSPRYRRELERAGRASTSTSRCSLAIEAAARRRGVPAAAAGRAPPPARRRVPGPHPRPRPAGAPAGQPRPSTCSGSATTTRSSTVTPAPTRGSSSTSPRYFPGAARPRARGQLPVPGTRGRRGPSPALLQPGAGAEGRSGPPIPVPWRARTPTRRVPAGRLAVRRHLPQAGATELVDVVRGWLDEPEVEPADVAVLSRVGSLLLAPHVALVEAGVPVSSILRADILGRTGLRAALAYLRIAAAPDAVDPDDLSEVHRRPSRGLPHWIDKWLGALPVGRRRRAGVAAHRRRQGGRQARRPGGRPHGRGRRSARDGTTRTVLEYVRDERRARRGDRVGSTRSGGGEGQSHRDDLDALLQVADLHPDPAGFAPWLRAAAAPARPTTAV